MPINGRYVADMVERGEFIWTTQPSSNGVGQAIFHPLDAQFALAQGFIVVNGARARVEQTCKEWPTVLHLYFEDPAEASQFNPRPTDAGNWTKPREAVAA